MTKSILKASALITLLAPLAVAMATNTTPKVPTQAMTLYLQGFSLPHSKSFTVMTSCNDQWQDTKNYTLHTSPATLNCPFTQYTPEAYEFELHIGKAIKMIHYVKAANSQPEITYLGTVATDPNIHCTKGPGAMGVTCALKTS